MDNKFFLKKNILVSLAAVFLFGLAILDVIFGWTGSFRNLFNEQNVLAPAFSENITSDRDSLREFSPQPARGFIVGENFPGFIAPHVSSITEGRSVDALPAPGPPGAVVVLYGTATGTVPGSYPPPGAWPNCASMLGSQWQLVYGGFGPHWIGIDEVYSWDGVGNSIAAGLMGGGAMITDFDAGAGALWPQFSSMARTALASDSVCSMSQHSIIPYKLSGRYTQSGNQGGFAGAAYACAETIGGYDGEGNPTGSGFLWCNTCSVCMRDT